MSEIKRIVVVEINEVKLVDELSKLTTEWMHDVRFTIEKSDDRDLTDEEKSATPQVFKYNLPKREEADNTHVPVALRNINTQPVPDVVPLYPAILIRPSDGLTGNNDNGYEYEEVSIDFCLFVNEYDIRDRYNFLLMGKKIIMQNLRSIPFGIVAMAYKLQPDITWRLLDDEQNPKASVLITTTWRCGATPFAPADFSQIDFG